MRAAVLNDYETTLEIEDLTPPVVGPSDVRLRVDASGVCHSDLLIHQGALPPRTQVAPLPCPSR